MPPKGKLPQAQIEILTAWVKLGVPWSEKSAAVHRPGSPPVDDRAQSFWSFQPVHRPDVPAVQIPAWVRNPIDAFIAAGLDAASLKPAAPASKTTLLRRVYFDLTGLPPSVEDVAGVSGRQFAAKPTKKSSIGCSPRRNTASAGRGTGSTWCATPKPTASKSMPPSPMSGATATMSSARSTTTSRTTSSFASNWPATNLTE